ncbi:tetrathionate reductase family octaheme c-type cytochrome [Candidatus Halobeggiatoa sp. HSG11]|nr:tetrathionate reductase family octaheme c-type cytochrome [Candidatus Halobeggiatoa sp. HSG11]
MKIRLIYSFLTLFFICYVTNAYSIDTNGHSTADHKKFKILQSPLLTGPEVTKACLSCHTEAAKQVHKTIHWQWQFTHPDTKQLLGKKNVINSFCGSIVSNYSHCTSCHVGYGWKDADFDFTKEENVDCLVCHDTTGTYEKFPDDAGHPTYEDKSYRGIVFKAPDLNYVAQNIGKTSRKTCGACHFFGGGGNGVKHGDLDSSLTEPDKDLDVHMDVDGLNFTCATCHTTDNHDVQGSRYTTVAKDTHGIDIPGRDDNSRATCESCHGMKPHLRTVNNKINDHTDKIACQTCHIPEYARGEVMTQTDWDWSQASKNSPMGEFEWDEELSPEYAWYAGNIHFTLLNEKIDPTKPVKINYFSGSYDDPNARIWPFKVMRGRQAYDKKNNTLVTTHVFGKDKAAYLQSFNWNDSIKAAMDSIGADYSGEYGFVDSTLMYWPLSHMIAPKEDALGCEDCHSKDGKLQNLTGFYMPGRDNNIWLDRIGWLIVLSTLAGILLHGLGRIVFTTKRRLK